MRWEHLLAAAVWDEDGVRDDLRDYVVQHLSDQADSSVGPVVVAHETGDVKKGRHTVGVARQYTGTPGRIDNAQGGVYLVYATSRGYAFIDREFYLPAAWADDLDRRQRAGVLEQVTFATKPGLARQMVT
jgi:SRSO17 transposase